jgi:hypothetical protein
MTPRSEREILIEYALGNEGNLAIALKLASAYHDLCGSVIVQFVEAVERELRPKLGDKWKVEICRDFQHLADKWAVFFTATFLGQPGQFHIVLGGDGLGYPKLVWLGVRALNASAGEKTRLKQVIDDNYANGKAGDPSFWYRPLDKAYASWGSEDTTVSLYRKKEAVDYLVRNLQQLATVIQGSLLPDNSSPNG